MDHLKLTVDSLSVDAITDLVVDASCGAVSIFVGTTRDNFEGKEVIHLDYEAYEPMALKAMKGICEELRREWPAVHSIAIYHRLGRVPAREASVVIAVSSPHRRDSLEAVAACIERLKARVPVWKREVYAGDPPQWKENKECPKPLPNPKDFFDKDLVQINVSNEEMKQRIQNFIERKREQVNVSNIHDFIPGKTETEDTETCARVRTQFVKRSDSKGHLKIRKVNNEWGPQTIQNSLTFKSDQGSGLPQTSDSGLPPAISERMLSMKRFLHIEPVSKDIYKRLKEVEDRVAYLQALSPEYSQFWRNKGAVEMKRERTVDYTFSADDIARKIEQLERHGGS